MHVGRRSTGSARPAHPRAHVRQPQSQTRPLAALALLAGCLSCWRRWRRTIPPTRRGRSSIPRAAVVANRCGPVGAYAAHAAVCGRGLCGASTSWARWAVVAVLLLMRREMNQPILRGVGWTASLAALATLAAMALQRSTPGPEIGAGGYVGAMGFALLESNFALAGAFILALSVLLAGLLLCTDYLLLKLAAKTTVVSGAGLVKLGRAGQRVAAAPASPGERSGSDRRRESRGRRRRGRIRGRSRRANGRRKTRRGGGGSRSDAELKVKTPPRRPKPPRRFRGRRNDRRHPARRGRTPRLSAERRRSRRGDADQEQPRPRSRSAPNATR